MNEEAVLDMAARALDEMAGLIDGYEEETEKAQLLAKGLRTILTSRRITALKPDTLERANPRNDYPEVECRGMLAQLGLRLFREELDDCDRAQVIIAANVRDAKDGSPAGWSHMREEEPGEDRHDALRAAILNFLEHELDEGLYVDRAQYRDPHIPKPADAT